MPSMFIEEKAINLEVMGFRSAIVVLKLEFCSSP
jgi:hypothetical protein